MAGAPLAPPPYAPTVPAVPVAAPVPTFMEVEVGQDQFGGDVIEVLMCLLSSRETTTWDFFFHHSVRPKPDMT